MTKPLIGIGADVMAGANERDQAFGYLTYANALRRSGAIPVLIPPQPENVQDLVGSLDGILLAGGEDCDPALYGEGRHSKTETMDVRRQDCELALARAARQGGVPTLGICLGLQVMTVAAGGTLVQDIDSEFSTDIRHASLPTSRARHEVRIEAGSRLSSILPGKLLNVNSSHHQSVRSPGTGLLVTAKAPDGVIEAIEDPVHPFYVGVQWHPEDMPGEESATSLFAAFVTAARSHADSRQREQSDNPSALQNRPE